MRKSITLSQLDIDRMSGRVEAFDVNGKAIKLSRTQRNIFLKVGTDEYNVDDVYREFGRRNILEDVILHITELNGTETLINAE